MRSAAPIAGLSVRAFLDGGSSGTASTSAPCDSVEGSTLSKWAPANTCSSASVAPCFMSEALSTTISQSLLVVGLACLAFLCESASSALKSTPCTRLPTSGSSVKTAGCASSKTSFAGASLSSTTSTPETATTELTTSTTSCEPATSAATSPVCATSISSPAKLYVSPVKRSKLR